MCRIDKIKNFVTVFSTAKVQQKLRFLSHGHITRRTIQTAAGGAIISQVKTELFGWFNGKKIQQLLVSVAWSHKPWQDVRVNTDKSGMLTFRCKLYHEQLKECIEFTAEQF
ncbi:hypothetical protein RRG08_051080 [Elysia crispata]|uniref:Uncharacterized protein n=1 Tax=Elysia crispata TaxID=231223 RepID=A0AAE1DY24_9GAST|nr:hypothetical protein RRG08_051080 [Elysia crispata]